jgi:hypothetical protein
VGAERSVTIRSVKAGWLALDSARSFRMLDFLPSVWCGRVGRQETSMALTILEFILIVPLMKSDRQQDWSREFDQGEL